MSGLPLGCIELDPSKCSAVGSTEHVAKMMQGYIDAGAQKFVMRPLCPAEETIEQLEIMGKEILPNFLKKPVSP